MVFLAFLRALAERCGLRSGSEGVDDVELADVNNVEPELGAIFAHLPADINEPPRPIPNIHHAREGSIIIPMHQPGSLLASRPTLPAPATRYPNWWKQLTRRQRLGFGFAVLLILLTIALTASYISAVKLVLNEEH
ncbi:hypothetical protein EDC01DRAFT_781964 [Geopyxis carbonaria]|nr:hypothetical protein EDC01DRAFT_781964 [Geopyxis carbonaria]